jgi:hypothetical protein
MAHIAIAAGSKKTRDSRVSRDSYDGSEQAAVANAYFDAVKQRNDAARKSQELAGQRQKDHLEALALLHQLDTGDIQQLINSLKSTQKSTAGPTTSLSTTQSMLGCLSGLEPLVKRRTYP